MDNQAKIASLEKTIAKLREQLITDELTQLLNRRGLIEMLQVLHKEVGFQLQNPEKRRNLVIRHLSVVFIDIDHFKQVNTDFGHPGGDAALVGVADVIKRRVRGIDVVGRYGGEEIVVGLVGADHSSAIEIAEDIKRSVAQNSIKFKNHNINLTISCGVASLAPNESLDNLLDRADQALYEAKNTGRNKVVAK